MKFPKNITRKEKKYLKEVYENALEKNKKKTNKKSAFNCKGKIL